jgi:hypothetical protein
MEPERQVLAIKVPERLVAETVWPECRVPAIKVPARLVAESMEPERQVLAIKVPERLVAETKRMQRIRNCRYQPFGRFKSKKVPPRHQVRKVRITSCNFGLRTLTETFR